MTPEADPVHFSRQIWQAVAEDALRAVARREFCPERSRIENLRPVFFQEEDDLAFGKQIWCFEAMGVSDSGRRQLIFGLMEFSIQFGLLEPVQSGLFEDASERERWIVQLSAFEATPEKTSGATKFWIWAAWISVALLGMGWLIALIRYLMQSSL